MPSGSKSRDRDPFHERPISCNCRVRMAQQSRGCQLEVLAFRDCTNSQQKLVVDALAMGMLIESIPEFPQKFTITGCLFVIGWVLVIDIEAV